MASVDLLVKVDRDIILYFILQVEVDGEYSGFYQSMNVASTNQLYFLSFFFCLSAFFPFFFQ